MASYISPSVNKHFEKLSDKLKSVIMEKNVSINNLNDFMNVLDQIVKENEGRKNPPS